MVVCRQPIREVKPWAYFPKLLISPPTCNYATLTSILQQKIPDTYIHLICLCFIKKHFYCHRLVFCVCGCENDCLVHLHLGENDCQLCLLWQIGCVWVNNCSVYQHYILYTWQIRWVGARMAALCISRLVRRGCGWPIVKKSQIWPSIFSAINPQIRI